MDQHGGPRDPSARPKRVVHYAAAATPGGLLGHLRLLASGAGARGWRAEAWIRPDRRLDPVAAEVARAGAEVRRLTVEGRSDLPGIARFARALLGARPDLLHVHLASPVESIPVLLVAGAATRIPIVVTEHAPTWHPLERRWSGPAKRRALRRVARVIALSRADADYLEAHFRVPPAKIRCLPNGVDLRSDIPPREEARRRLGVEAGVPVAGYVGEIAEKKGLADLVEAARREEAGNATLFLLAGEGPFEGELRERIARAGLGSRFRLLGAVRPPVDLYAASDFFVLPSHGEAMPLALLEAMSASLPVVATRVGGIPEVLREGEAGILVPPGDPPALARAIGSLAADPAARERLGAAARLRVLEAFSAERMAAATCDLYDEILAEGR